MNAVIGHVGEIPPTFLVREIYAGSTWDVSVGLYVTTVFYLQERGEKERTEIHSEREAEFSTNWKTQVMIYSYKFFSLTWQE